MIVPRSAPPSTSVAAHYEELDTFYREIWGEHVHHGYWNSRADSPEVAVTRLVSYVAEKAHIRPHDAVCDIGSGYGATARLLVGRYGARVSALTLVAAQHAYALRCAEADSNPLYLLGDWCDNSLASGAFDAAIAIESIEHMADKPHALREAARVLKPGGRLVICCWLAAEHCRGWRVQHLLEPICCEGRLPGLGSESDYRRFISQAGFELDAFDDITRHVRRTWLICLRRTCRAVLTETRYREFLLNPANQNRAFAVTMVRILVAYTTGAMRYGVLTARRS